MKNLKVLLLLFTLFISVTSSATVFFVTSNADSGVGTLREALQKAADNGNSEKDFIYFNLPDLSEDGRTIIVMSQLPNISSDLVIDGTSQPGNKFGVSDCKVWIKVGVKPANLHGLVCSVNGISVEIYSLVISGFSGVYNLNNNTEFGSGIYLKATGKYILGAPGKGNVIGDCYFGIRGNISNSKIQSNLIGVYFDGESLLKNIDGIYSQIRYDNINNAIIGGELREEGNIISGSKRGISFETPATSGLGEKVSILNNSFGTNYNETVSSILNYGGEHIYIPQSLVVDIRKNVFSANQFGINGSNMNLNIKGNFFGTNRLQNIALGKSYSAAIQSLNRSYMSIGGENQEDQNIFTNYGQPIILSNYSTAKVIKNSFYCNNLVSINYPYPVNFQPVFKILILTDNKVSGISFPNSLIQLYYSENSCGSCNPKERFAPVISDASGKWEYNGTITGPILASTTSGEETFGFEPISIQNNEVTVKDFYCNQKGSIEINTKRQGNFEFYWKDKDGNILSRDQFVNNLEPGTYYLEYGIKGGCLNRSSFNIQNRIPQTYASSHNIPCSVKEITFSSSNYNINITPYVNTYYYEDLIGNIISMKNSSLITLSEGQYYFYIKDINGCLSNKSLVNIIRVKETPKIDESSVQIINVTCNKTDGSIKNLKFEDDGSVFFRWYDEKNQIVAFTKDLINKGTGKYRLELSRNFGCEPEVSSIFEIKEINGITSNQTSLKINAANCNKSNGSITGLNISGAITYQWLNEANQKVGDKIELLNQPAGKYRLIGNNQTCSKEFGPFTIDLIPPKNYGIPNNTVLFPTCGEINGSIEVNFKTDIAPAKYDWRKTDGTSLNINANKITNLNVGKYSLFLIDENSCEQFIGTYEVKEGRPAMAIVNNSWKTVADNCGTSTGSITGIRFNYENGPNDFSWFNDKGKIISTEKDLKNVKSGNFKLLIKNQYCANTFDFFLPYKEELLSKPIVSDVFICAPTEIHLLIKEDAHSYSLYDETGKIFAQSSTNQMSIKVSENKKFALTYKLGNCESEKAYFTVNIGSSSISIPSAFTPNGDGVNDNWVIGGLDLYSSAKITIFNRYGQELYKRQGGTFYFDGVVKGVKLQSGTYYYIIKLSDDCKPFSGSLLIAN